MIRSLYWKMMAGFGLIIIALIVVNGLVLYRLHDVRGTLRSIIAVDIQVIDLARALRSSLVDEEQNAQKFLITRDSLYATLLKDQTNRTSEILDSLLILRGDRQASPGLRRIRRGHEQLYASLTDTADLHPLPSEQTVVDSMESYIATAEAIQREMQNGVGRAMMRVEEIADRSLNTTLTLGLASLVGMVVAALLIARSITRPLRILEEGTQQVARGNFSAIPVVSRDEIGRLALAFNAMSAQLQKIDELKADMLHHISHELRVPLQSVMAAYYLLSEEHRGPLNEEQQKLLGLIRDNIDRIVRFSNQFLDLAKIEAGAMEFALAPIEVDPVVRTSMQNVQLLAQRKNIVLDLAVEDVPVVLGDREKLEEVFSNLLSNAVKYTRPGGRVDVHVHRIRSGVGVSVHDTGIGIHPDDLPHVFTKFYRARNVSRADGKGSGVGLALVKAIVEGHNGRVTAASIPGEGSSFTVELPAAATLDLVATLESTPEQSST